MLILKGILLVLFVLGSHLFAGYLLNKYFFSLDTEDHHDLPKDETPENDYYND